MAQQLLHKLSSHSSMRLAQPASILAPRAPPVRCPLRSAADSAQSVCSTSYQTTWPKFERGSRARAVGRGQNADADQDPGESKGGFEDVTSVAVDGDFEGTTRSLLGRRRPGRPRSSLMQTTTAAATTPAEGAGTASYGEFDDAEIKETGLARTAFFEGYFHEPEKGWRDLPMNLMPRTEEEERRLKSLLQLLTFQKRVWDHEELDDWAFYESGKMLEKSHNIYANVLQVAGMMRRLEQEDFALGEQQTRFGSWSRAEILFATKFDEFNASVKANIDSMVRQPLEEELREKLEAIGEATLLPPTEAEQQEPKFPSATDMVMFMDQNYLEGILPGVSLANPTERYAEDIYAGEDSADELFNLVDAEAEEGEGEE